MLLILYAVSTLVQSKTTIECKPVKQGENIYIILNAKKFKSAFLNCIETNRDLGEGEICAPENGWGLQFPTGKSQISKVVFRWQEYIDHYGAVNGNRITNTEITISRGQNESTKGYVENWQLILNRVEGNARLTMFGENYKNNKSEEFKCSKIDAKF